MKKSISVVFSVFFLLFTLFTFSIPAFSETVADAVSALKSASSEKAEIRFSAGHGTIKELKGRFSIPPKEDTSEAVLDFIDAHRQAFRLQNPKSELKLQRKKEYKEGDRHFRYQQAYNGLPVWGKQVLVTVNAGNEIDDVTANYIPTTRIDTAPSLTATEAVQKASEAIKSDFSIKLFKDRNAEQEKPKSMAGKKMWREPESELVIYPSANIVRLAYLVRLSVTNPPGWWFVFVDAKDGSIIEKFNNIKYDAPAIGTGTLWDGASVGIGLYDHSGAYWLMDASKPMANVQATDFTSGYIQYWNVDGELNTSTINSAFLSNGTINVWNANNHTFLASDGHYYGDYQSTMPVTSVSTTVSGLTSGVNTLYYQTEVYDFFKDTFGRNSWDDAGGSLLGVAHYGSGYDNAFWNGYFMTYGDGSNNPNGGFTDLSRGRDVIAHEIGHGVTQAEVTPDGLTYFAQSGAMNEHISDFWGICVDSDDYLLGEDVMPASSYTALRDFANPGDTTVMSPTPASMSRFYYSLIDNAGVHSNCGILNKAAYQMMISPAIGREKTERLYYRAYDYLDQDSHFFDLREALKKAALCAYPDEYVGIAGAIQNIFVNQGIKTPPARETFRYDNGTPIYLWSYTRNTYSNTYKYGNFFVPSYSGKVAGAYIRFYGSPGWVTVEVLNENLTLLYSTSYYVSNVTGFSYVQLGNIPFENSFIIRVTPTDQTVILSDDGTNKPHNSKYVNLLWENGTPYLLNDGKKDYTNFLIRPRIVYDSAEGIITPRFSQNGNKVSVTAQLNHYGDAAGAYIKFETSSDGGTKWVLRTTGTSNSKGFCASTLTLPNGIYKVRARYDYGATHLVSSPLLDVVVEPVAADPTPAIVNTCTPAISWNAFAYANATVNGYTVQTSGDSTFTTIEDTKSFGSGVTSADLPTLPLGRKRYWRIIAELTTGRSVPSAARAVTFKKTVSLDGFDPRESGSKVQPFARVSDAAGGIPGRVISFKYRKQGALTWSTLGSATTNYQGNAWLPAAMALPLGLGTYSIKATFAGDAMYTAAADAGPDTVALPAAKQTGEISVTVTDYNSGLPVTTATVKLFASPTSTTPLASLPTDGAGTASFSSLNESFNYLVKVSCSGYVGLKCYNIAVSGGSSTAVNLSLVPAGTSTTGSIGGTVTNGVSPVSGATVRLRAGSGAYTTTILKTTTTAANGSYSFSGLNAGVYTAEIIKAGYRQNFKTVYCIGGTTTGGQDASLERY